MKLAYLAKSLLTKGHPYHVQWFITRKCNYRCKSCDVWRTQAEDELSLEDVLQGLDNLRKLKVTEITFSGGNPLLREDMGEILRYSSKYFITTIYDNGSMAYKRIGDLKHADYVAISLDTLNEKKQDHLNGVKGSLRMKIKSINELIKNRVPVAISPTISELTRDEIPKMIKKLGLPFNFCLYESDFDPAQAQFSIGREVKELKIRERKKMAGLFEKLLELKHSYSILLQDECLIAMKKYYESGKRNWRCGALDKFLTIDHKGGVSGCHLKQAVASISNLPDFWNSKQAEQIRLKNKRCKNCVYLCYVDYSLPILSFASTILTGIKANPKGILNPLLR
jgi:MoaA/NifB/PqqE/SkfB family radical SAM enzyme